MTDAVSSPFLEAIKQLPEKERLESLTAILEYGLDEIEPKSAGVASAMFLMAKPQIDANNRRYQNGTKGGRPTEEAFRTAINAHMKHGTTSIFPTLSSSTVPMIEAAAETCTRLMAEPDSPVLGLHLEGHPS